MSFNAKKRKGIVFLLIGLAIPVGIFAWDFVRIGKVTASLNGVPVHYNGLWFTRSQGKHFAEDGYYYGQKWQCVEFVKRYYHDRYGHQMPEVFGHARDFFNYSIPHGGLNPQRGMLQFENGNPEKPRPEDLLVFTDTQYGHVAIVSRVENGMVEVVQQNILFQPVQSWPLVESNGIWTIGVERKPIGWLRMEGGSLGTSEQYK